MPSGFDIPYRDMRSPWNKPYLCRALVLVALFLSLTLLLQCGASVETPVAKKGVMDLRSYDFASRGPLNLDGEWEFFWQRFLSENQNDSETSNTYASLPGVWNGRKLRGETISGNGYATYRLRLLLGSSDKTLSMHINDVATSYRFFLNGKLILANGKVGKTKASSVPAYFPTVVHLNDLRKENEFILEISNFAHRKGGPWTSISIGTDQHIQSRREQNISMDLFLAGAFAIMALYHLGLFALRRKDRSSLFFGLFCILTIIRMISVGERTIILAFPDLPWIWLNKLEYLSAYLGGPVFMVFLYQMYHENMNRLVYRIFLILFLSLSSLIVIFPIGIYSHTLLIWMGVVTASFFWGFYFIRKSALQGRNEAIAALLGFFIFATAILNDMLYAMNVVNTGHWMPYGLFVFIFSQSIMLSMRFSLAFRSIERLSDHLLETNEAYSRFVPNQVLTLLKKSSIIEIKLGDQIQGEMTVLFSDIRSFTELSESMTPKENFDFLNSYLNRMVPIIVENDGFIDKYIGDSIMAIFPGIPDRAIRAAVQMQHELIMYNRQREKQSYRSLEIGTGIHTGDLMMGIIGGEDRMESTVISDAVNLASRIENLTKTMGAPIMVSESTLQNIRNPNIFRHRLLGRSRVKGKKKIVTIYQILDGYRETEIGRYMQTKDEFEKGVQLLHAGDMPGAAALFDNILQINPGDLSAKYYLERCRHLNGQTIE